MADRDLHPGIRPRQTLLRRLDAAARRGMPVALCALAVLILSAPVGLPGAAELMPGLLLGAVFFWSVFRPTCMAALPVFLLGLLCDLMSSTPPGMMALLLLSTHWLAFSRRASFSRYRFVPIWSAFSLIAMIACAAQWAVVSLFRLHPAPGGPALFEAALACALYPLLSALFTGAYRGIADPRRA